MRKPLSIFVFVILFALIGFATARADVITGICELDYQKCVTHCKSVGPPSPTCLDTCDTDYDTCQIGDYCPLHPYCPYLVAHGSTKHKPALGEHGS
jgi:hypothetical protein